MADKPLAWLHGEVKTPPFTREARIEAGYYLRKLQQGERLSMPVSRTMPSIGSNRHELRIEDADITWRILYHVATEAVVILEVFGKKTKKAPKYAIDAARKRLKHYITPIERKLTMRAEKRKRLEASGWRLGDAKDFLELNEIDAQLVEMKLTLARRLRELREQLEITQEELAKRLGSSQSRVAKMEAGDPSVSMELLIRSLLAAGANRSEIGRSLGSRRR